MSTIPSVINVRNLHRSFEFCVAKFYLAQYFDEQLDSCTVSRLLLKCSPDGTSLYKSYPNEQKVDETHLMNIPSDRFLPRARMNFVHGPHQGKVQ